MFQVIGSMYLKLTWEYFQLSIAVFGSVLTFMEAIVTSPLNDASEVESVKKEKRGVLGYGVYGHHHAHHHPHSDEFLNHFHHHGLPHSVPFHHHHAPSYPVPLGAHAHTTIVKKLGIPVPVPYPVKV